MDEKNLKFNYDRRFGVEIELNSSDQRDFKNQPLDKGESPSGIQYIATIIQEKIKCPVKISGWHHTHNNFDEWVLKPDSSCGIEVCSPPVRGHVGLMQIVAAIEALSKDKEVKIDNRCSFHTHFGIEDCLVKSTRPSMGYKAPATSYDFEKSVQLAAILAWWIKCEPVFLDSVPQHRKKNRYCQCIGMLDMFQHDDEIDPARIISVLGEHKYCTINTFHLVKGKRPTIEFRIIEWEGCCNAHLAKNWIKLLAHFIETAKTRGLPKSYEPGNQWSSLLWLDPKDVLEFLGFAGSGLSPNMIETRNWFLARLLSNAKSDLTGVWGKEARIKSIKEIEELVSIAGMDEKNLDMYLRQ